MHLSVDLNHLVDSEPVRSYTELDVDSHVEHRFTSLCDGSGQVYTLSSLARCQDYMILPTDYAMSVCAAQMSPAGYGAIPTPHPQPALRPA